MDVEESIHLVTLGRKAKANPERLSLLANQTDQSMHFAQMNHLFTQDPPKVPVESVNDRVEVQKDPSPPNTPHKVDLPTEFQVVRTQL